MRTSAVMLLLECQQQYLQLRGKSWFRKNIIGCFRNWNVFVSGRLQIFASFSLFCGFRCTIAHLEWQLQCFISV